MGHKRAWLSPQEARDLREQNNQFDARKKRTRKLSNRRRKPLAQSTRTAKQTKLWKE
jgi:hypothetical protein